MRTLITSFLFVNLSDKYTKKLCLLFMYSTFIMVNNFELAFIFILILIIFFILNFFNFNLISLIFGNFVCF